MSTPLDDTPSCGTSLHALSRWHDGDLVDPALERHIQSCDECRLRLHDLGSAAIAVAGISGVPHVSARIASTTARQGRLDIADLVHELALACLALHGGATAGATACGSPRPFAAVLADIRSLDRRLRELGCAPDASALPAAEPRREQALAAARACAAVLAQLEGPSARQVAALAASESPRAGAHG